VDVITGTTDPDRDRTVFQQLSFENDNEQRGAASRSCHVIYNVSPSTSWEIYRLDRDPEETRDLSGDPGPCAATRAALERWYDASEIPPGAVAALVRDPLPVARRLDIDFGDEVRLVAVDLPSEPVRRGETFDAVFLWEARGRLRGGWKVFAHFEAKTGGRFLGDHAPVRPFDWWRRGDTIRYTQKVTIPASTRAGAYTLWVGLFRDAQRLPARSGAVDVRDDRAPVGTVEVVP
jgi:hypothetical protein